ncbi:anthocyanin regulatory R-S protein-like [Triticum urartu]|nr:anthocyanin regulatory R-S protein-like [Triticum urartu]
MALSAAAPGQQEPPSGKQLSYQLAAAVRSINWTYAIFWSMSTGLRPPGVLTWKNGFYNGEVKTRKIISSTTTELTADDLVLQRSEQLRELYQSLLSGKADHRAKRPAASLSPEDLGEAEWYYTLSMTYAFQPGQGLPGKSFASNQHVWLYNAQYADTKTFQRALLAKTAPIQTVVCIPFMGGVLELGTLDLVLEDPNMVNQIGTSFWELPFLACSESELPSSNPSTDEAGNGEVDIVVLEDLDHNVAKGMISKLGEVECMSDVNLDHVTEEVDEFYGLIEELDVRSLEDNWVMERSFEYMSSLEMAPDMDTRSIDDAIITLSSFVKGSRPSCFTVWKRSSDCEDVVARVTGESQKLLKKAIAGGAWTARPQESNIKTHVLSERRRREKLNDMFLVLKSMVPSINKMDKASILAETITYLRELEQRVEELETSRAPSSHPNEAMGRGLHEVVGRKKIKLSTGSKRKVLETEREDNDCPSNIVNVTVMDKEVLLEVQCRWKELLMTRVFDAIKSLRLDIVSVHASTPEGLLDLKIRATQQASIAPTSKLAVGSAAIAPGMITEALQKAICIR